MFVSDNRLIELFSEHLQRGTYANGPLEQRFEHGIINIRINE